LSLGGIGTWIINEVVQKLRRNLPFHVCRIHEPARKWRDEEAGVIGEAFKNVKTLAATVNENHPGNRATLLVVNHFREDFLSQVRIPISG
jgi:hypothetical protein